MPANRVVYAIGDSLIGSEYRRGQPLYHFWGAVGDGVTLKAQGVGGDTSAQVLARLERDVIDQTPRPDTCIVLAGINDIQMNAPASTVIANLEAIYRRLLQAGIHVIALSIYPFGSYDAWTSRRERVRQEVLAWMRSGLPATLPAVEVVDVEDVVGDLREPDRPRIKLDYDDGTQLHLNEDGAAAVARALLSRSERLLGLQG